MRELASLRFAESPLLRSQHKNHRKPNPPLHFVSLSPRFYEVNIKSKSRSAGFILLFLNPSESKLSSVFEIKKTESFNSVFMYWYRRRDLNPHGHYCPLDFKSNVSTNSTTSASDLKIKINLTFRAKNGIRTRDLHLGKVALYQLSYFRENKMNVLCN